MRIGRIYLFAAAVVTGLVACTSYGGEDGANPFADAGSLGPDASVIADAQVGQPDGGPNNEDTDAATDGSTDASISAQAIDVSAACIRAPGGLKRLPQTHILSVYGAAANGTITVNVAAKDVTLVLSSFDQVTWNITASKGAPSKVYLYGKGTVAGVLATSVQKGTATAYSYGYTRKQNLGGGDFAKQIATIRSDIGGLESTYQGVYSGATFSVGGTLPAPEKIESYDTSVTCVNPCLRASTVSQWTDLQGKATITGLTAVSKAGESAELRVSPGVACGKHYFEVASSTLQTFAIAGTELDHSLGTSPSKLAVLGGNGPVGVAVDLDANVVTYTIGTTTKEQPLGLWYREVVGPAFEVSGAATITLTTKKPFTGTPTAGYAADL